MLADKYISSKRKRKIMDSFFMQEMYYHLPQGIQAEISKLIFHPHFSKHTLIYPGMKFYYGDVNIGEWTSMSGDGCYANITAGNYTMFARGFRSIHFIHDYHAFTSNDGIKRYISSLRDVDLNDPSILEPSAISYKQTVVGNDVWLGEDVTVIGGVHIGDGAVIGARSVVTHDVAPYSVVGGVPARFIKWRFDEDTIDYLEKLSWWNWSQEKIAANYERLCKFDRTLLNE